MHGRDAQDGNVLFSQHLHEKVFRHETRDVCVLHPEVSQPANSPARLVLEPLAFRIRSTSTMGKSESYSCLARVRRISGSVRVRDGSP